MHYAKSGAERRAEWYTLNHDAAGHHREFEGWWSPDRQHAPPPPPLPPKHFGPPCPEAVAEAVRLAKFEARARRGTRECAYRNEQVRLGRWRSYWQTMTADELAELEALPLPEVDIFADAPPPQAGVVSVSYSYTRRTT